MTDTEIAAFQALNVPLGQHRSYADLIKLSKPPACPPGYHDYGEITGRSEGTHTGVNFEARRLCLTD